MGAGGGALPSPPPGSADHIALTAILNRQDVFGKRFLTTHHHTSTQRALALQGGSPHRVRSASIARGQFALTFPQASRRPISDTMISEHLSHVQSQPSLYCMHGHVDFSTFFKRILNKGSSRCLSLCARLSKNVCATSALLPFIKWCSQNSFSKFVQFLLNDFRPLS